MVKLQVEPADLAPSHCLLRHLEAEPLQTLQPLQPLQPLGSEPEEGEAYVPGFLPRGRTLSQRQSY